MTPTETVAFLRNYNVWRRGNLEGMPQPDPREIGEAIDAAVAMIDRLEAAEKELAEIRHGAAVANDTIKALRAQIEAIHSLLDGDESKIIRNAKDGYPEGREPKELTLTERVTALCKYASDWERWFSEAESKIERMERQEPAAWARKLAMGLPSFGCVTDLKYRPSNMPESAYMPLYALPGAQTQGEKK